MDFLTSNNNLFILAIAAASGLMLLWPTLNRSRGGSSTVDSTQAVQWINQRHAVVVDVRPAEQFAAGHIAQARNLPFADIEQKAATLPKNKPLVVVCDAGRVAGRAAAKLKSLGHAEIAVLDGGLRAWTQGGLPLTNKKS